MKLKVAVALSGGLDSAVSAAILKKENCQGIGIHFKTGYESPAQDPTSITHSSRVSSGAQSVAEQVGIPLEVVNCSRPFEKEVVGPFVDTYRSGQTPSPCMVCNQRIKFGFVLDRALALGASALATGHYARVTRTDNGRFCLLKGADRAKDQSYFLALLTQEQLSRAVFPLETRTKKQVRQMAQSLGLTGFIEKESQELCFVRHGSYRDFLSKVGKFTFKPGPIVNTAGDILGEHKGLHAYTIGQRKGIGIPGPQPYYVIRIDSSHNRLVVGSKPELAAQQCTVTHINWIDTEMPNRPISVKTRVRYRHQEADSTLTPLGDSRAVVDFSRPQYAITPGQAAVFYEGDRVLGGGWIA